MGRRRKVGDTTLDPAGLNELWQHLIDRIGAVRGVEWAIRRALGCRKNGRGPRLDGIDDDSIERFGAEVLEHAVRTAIRRAGLLALDSSRLEEEVFNKLGRVVHFDAVAVVRAVERHRATLEEELMADMVARVASGLAGEHREDWSAPRLRGATVRFAGDRAGEDEHTPAAAVRTLGRVLDVFAGAKPSESKNVLTAGRDIDGLLVRFAPWSREEGALDPWFEVFRGDRRGWDRVDRLRGLHLTRREALRLARKEHAKDGAWWRVYRFVPDGAGEEPGPYCLLDLLPRGDLPRRCRDGVYADPPGNRVHGAEGSLALSGGRSLRIDSKGRLHVTFASVEEAEFVAGALLADRQMFRAGYTAARRGAVLLRGIEAIQAELAALALVGRRR